MNGPRHTPRAPRAPLSLLLLALLGTSLSAPSQAAAPSELQQFRSYPYIERAYRALDSQPAEAEKLVRHVLEEISQEHAEAQRILLQALQRQGRYAEALDVCAKLPAEQAAPLREELRLAWIGSDQGVPAATLDGWPACRVACRTMLGATGRPTSPNASRTGRQCAPAWPGRAV